MYHGELLQGNPCHVFTKSAAENHRWLQLCCIKPEEPKMGYLHSQNHSLVSRSLKKHQLKRCTLSPSSLSLFSSHQFSVLPLLVSRSPRSLVLRSKTLTSSSLRRALTRNSPLPGFSLTWVSTPPLPMITILGSVDALAGRMRRDQLICVLQISS
jgi:hypothetical protein